MMVSSRAFRRQRGQRGSALFIALISLLALTFTGLAMVRAMDSATLIAGNFSFRQAALNVADIGVEAALKDLGSIYLALGRDNNYPANCTTNCTYYAWYPNPDQNASATSGAGGAKAHCDAGTDCDNTNGVSQRIDWASETLPSTTISFTALGTGYSYKYVVERLCDMARAGTVVATSDVPKYCFSMTSPSVGSSQESASTRLGSLSTSREVAYRATIRIVGPRNASATVQAIFSKN